MGFISSAIPKGHTTPAIPDAKGSEQSQPQWKAAAALWLWSTRVEGETTDDKATQPGLSQWHQGLRPPGTQWRGLSSVCHCLLASFPLPLTHSIGFFFLCLLRVTSKHENSEMMNCVFLRTIYLYQQSCYYIKYLSDISRIKPSWDFNYITLSPFLHCLGVKSCSYPFHRNVV